MPSWSERELEDWLWEHPNAIEEDIHWIGRQVPLPNGQIVDLLGVEKSGADIAGLVVAELKAVAANGEALSQLLSYMQMLQMATLARSQDFLPEYVTEDCSLFSEDSVAGGFLYVRGYLIAPEFTERVLLSAAMLERNITLKFAKHAFAFNNLNHEWVEATTEQDWPDKLADVLNTALSTVE